MKGLLLFFFRYRWPYLLLCSFLGGMFTVVFLQQGWAQGLFLPPLVFLYSSLTDTFGQKRKDEEFIPRLALPFGKRTFIAYATIRTIAYYGVCAIIAFVWISCLLWLSPRGMVHLELLPFLAIFLAGMHAAALLGDCFTGLRFGKVVGFPLMLACLFISNPFGIAISRIDGTGGIDVIRRSLDSAVSWTVFNPELAISAACTVFAVSFAIQFLDAGRIKF